MKKLKINNKEKVKIYNQEYREENKEKIKEQKKIYKKEHIEEYKEIKKRDGRIKVEKDLRDTVKKLIYDNSAMINPKNNNK